MGRKGVFASTAAGISLLGAAICVVLAVSGFVAFKGFKTADSTREIHQDARLADVRSASTPQPQRIVVGARHRAAAQRAAAAAAEHRARARREAAYARRARRRSGRRGAHTRPADARETAPVDRPEREAEAPVAPDVTKPSAPVALPEPSRDPAQAAKPVRELVEGVTKPVETVAEKVGDVLLDVRDVLP